MIGSRLVSCLNKLWQVYPCKYIPRYASSCGNPECKNPKCSGKEICDPCPPPTDPCSCKPKPDPCCPPPQPPCCPPLDVSCSCKKDKKPPCPPPKPKCPPPPCPPKCPPPCPPPCPPKCPPPCPPPCPPKCPPPCPPPCPPKCPPPCPPPCPPKCPPPCPPPCPPKKKCVTKEPPCLRPPIPTYKEVVKTVSAPMNLMGAPCEIDEAAKELCQKAIETCAEARKILELYKTRRSVEQEMQLLDAKSCQQKRKPVGLAKQKVSETATRKILVEDKVDSSPRIYNSVKSREINFGCTSTKRSGSGTCNGASSCTCPYCKRKKLNSNPIKFKSASSKCCMCGPTSTCALSKNLNTTTTVRHMSTHLKTEWCDENCPRSNKNGTACIEAAKAEFKERFNNEFAVSEIMACQECNKYEGECKCVKCENASIKEIAEMSISSSQKPQGKSPTLHKISTSTSQVRNSNIIGNNVHTGSLLLKRPNLHKKLDKQEIKGAALSGVAVLVTKVVKSLSKICGTSVEEANSEDSPNQTELDEIKTNSASKKPAKSRIPCTKNVWEKSVELEAAAANKSNLISDAAYQVAAAASDGTKTPGVAPGESKMDKDPKTHVKSETTHKVSSNKSEPRKGGSAELCQFCKQTGKSCLCKHNISGKKNPLATIKSQESPVNRATKKCDKPCPLGKHVDDTCTCIKKQRELVANKILSEKAEKQSSTHQTIDKKRTSAVCANCNKFSTACKCPKKLQAKENKETKTSSTLVIATCPLCKQEKEACNCLKTKKSASARLYQLNCPVCKKEEVSCKCLQKPSNMKQTRRFSKVANLKLRVNDGMSTTNNDQSFVTIESLVSSQKLAAEKEKIRNNGDDGAFLTIESLLLAQKMAAEESNEENEAKAADDQYSEESEVECNLESMKSQHSPIDHVPYEEDEKLYISFRDGPFRKLSKKYHQVTPLESDTACSELEEVVEPCPENEEKLITIKSLLSNQIKSMIDAGICPVCKKVNDDCACKKTEQPYMLISLQSEIKPKFSRNYHKLVKVQESIENITDKLTKSQYKLSVKAEKSKETPYVKPTNSQYKLTDLKESNNKMQDLTTKYSNALLDKRQEINLITEHAKISANHNSTNKSCKKRTQSTSAIPYRNDLRCSCCKLNLIDAINCATPCSKCQQASKACIEFLCKKYKRMEDKSKLELRASYPWSNGSHSLYAIPPSSILCNRQSTYKVQSALSQRLGINLSTISRFCNKPGPPSGRSDTPGKDNKTIAKKTSSVDRRPGPQRPPNQQNSASGGSSYVIKEPQCDLLCELQSVFRDQSQYECQQLHKYYGTCYDNKEYHSYNEYTFYELENYMNKYRNSQPSNKGANRRP